MLSGSKMFIKEKTGMKLKTFPFLLFLLLPFPFFTFSQNTLTLNNGGTIKGKTREETNRYIKIEVVGVSLTYYLLEEIASIEGQPLSARATPSCQLSSRTTLPPSRLYLNKAIQLEPNFGGTYFLRALVYGEKGDYPQAWEDIERAEGLGFKVPQEFISELEKTPKEEGLGVTKK